MYNSQTLKRASQSEGRDNGEDVDVTRLLDLWRCGDDTAANTLFASLYPQLRTIAYAKMRGERSDHTLQATALVSESFVRIASAIAPIF